MAEQMPQVIGEYKIMRPVASGAMGMVYVGNTEGNVYHAIKVLDPAVAEKTSVAKRFVSDISGPHIFDYKAIDVGPSGRTYFVTEYLEVKPISRERLAGIRTAGFLELFAKLADQLHAVHSKGVAHGNIKTSNVLVRKPESGHVEARIADFGINYVYSPADFSAAMFARTFPYMSPERINQIVTRVQNDEIPPNPSMDIYSLCVTLCEVLTGELVYSDVTDVKTLLEKKKKRKYVVVGMNRPASSFDLDKLNMVVARATAFNPRERFATMAELAEGLRGCIV